MHTNKIDKPLFIFDGECLFCRCFINNWYNLVGSSVEFVPYQKLKNLDIQKSKLESSVHFVSKSQTYSGAKAIFFLLANFSEDISISFLNKIFFWMYLKLSLFAKLSEGIYQYVATHRKYFYAWVKLLWGSQCEPPTFVYARWIFLRALSIVYFFAFFSFWYQVPALIGNNGIVPSSIFLHLVEKNLGWEGYWLYPTLAWINPNSDGLLHLIGFLGVLFSIFLFFGIAARFSLIILYLCYLSYVTVGQVFMHFQWDILLLETGFLAIFLAPSGFVTFFDQGKPPSKYLLFALWLVLFKLMFLSGVVKIVSNDPSWQNLTALAYHYETQPLPSPLAWYFHKLPLLIQKFSTAYTFFVELLIPLLIFAPRKLRFVGGFLFISLQLLIMMTGSYAFFNILTISLTILLFDDHLLKRFLPNELLQKIEIDHSKRLSVVAKVLVPMFSLLLIMLNIIQISNVLFRNRLPEVFKTPLSWIAPLRISNSYGLFAVMTTIRGEVIIEGSNDGEIWKEYQFYFKPDDVRKSPSWIAPLQPRLDWQMWFAALSDYTQNPWFTNLLIRLISNEPDVLYLLKENPFPQTPPRYIRAVYYVYKFSDWQNKQNGWWEREYKGIYHPVISRQ